LREAQSIPDTRGKDLDLAFDGIEIRSRVAAWFEYAQGVAEKRPGEVLVVVAGDGLNPMRDVVDRASSLLHAHRRLLRDSAVRYLRIQHAQATHLCWLKDFLATVDERSDDGESVGLNLEAEHGASVSVVMVAVRHPEHRADGPGWTLEGWEILRCGVLFADLSGSHGDVRVAMFTEPHHERVNQELLHFGRVHCERLLGQGPGGALSPKDFQQDLVDQLARWVERVRRWSVTASMVPPPGKARTRWIARRLGIADPVLAEMLGAQMDEVGDHHEAARLLWEQVEPWPGLKWAPSTPAD
jgi:hypothetical protein